MSASRNAKVQRARPSNTQDGRSALCLFPLRARVAELAPPVSAGSQRGTSFVCHGTFLDPAKRGGDETEHGKNHQSELN